MGKAGAVTTAGRIFTAIFNQPVPEDGGELTKRIVLDFEANITKPNDILANDILPNGSLE